MPRFTGFRPDVRFLGSTLTLVLGAMYFLGTVGQIAQGVNSTGLVVGPVNNAGPVVGPMMFLGALPHSGNISRCRSPFMRFRSSRPKPETNSPPYDPAMMSRVGYWPRYQAGKRRETSSDLPYLGGITISRSCTSPLGILLREAPGRQLKTSTPVPHPRQPPCRTRAPCAGTRYSRALQHPQTPHTVHRR